MRKALAQWLRTMVDRLDPPPRRVDTYTVTCADPAKFREFLTQRPGAGYSDYF